MPAFGVFLVRIFVHSAEVKDMADLVLEVINKNNIDVINCRGQSYDNESNMSGTY